MSKIQFTTIVWCVSAHFVAIWSGKKTLGCLGRGTKLKNVAVWWQSTERRSLCVMCNISLQIMTNRVLHSCYHLWSLCRTTAGDVFSDGRCHKFYLFILYSNQANMQQSVIDDPDVILYTYETAIRFVRLICVSKWCESWMLKISDLMVSEMLDPITWIISRCTFCIEKCGYAFLMIINMKEYFGFDLQCTSDCLKICALLGNVLLFVTWKTESVFLSCVVSERGVKPQKGNSIAQEVLLFAFDAYVCLHKYF